MATVLELDIERPVAGGRMLARHDGQVVFVAGALPGERVRARIERRQKQVLFAATVDVLTASPDRRTPPCDLSCGGSAYAHIQLARQRALKGEIVADAFARIAKYPLAAAVPVAASPDSGYRMRARVHVDVSGPAPRWGFYREGTHVLCDARATGQLLPATADALDAFVDAQASVVRHLDAMTVSENARATTRLLLLEPRPGAAGIAGIAGATPGIDGITRADGAVLAGAAWLEDTAAGFWPGGAPIDPGVTWRRRPASFVQGNRHLVGALVSRVLEACGGAGAVVDLYAGGGLFSVALAARGARVAAVEVDASGVADLRDNAQAVGDHLAVHATSVEAAVAGPPPFMPDVLVLDPPRTGASPEAIAGLAAWRAPKIVYVSCDPPTLARDVKKLIEAGYHVTSVDGFDMFPNTAHVEAVVTLAR